ncbi:hypothetical protein BT96DRAFT_817518 [Gymnopus androsaceus JB14]|uniref:CCHC-type domain-containing protein n=1 Tax=Gymnopus androsaceus JB14 TaxID=1447944 RepID=A0A6A4HY54_9AGAR|nr:hypothetical protein BT96DRAFT_817518 [Gymnopus androsaceus JB14]
MDPDKLTVDAVITRLLNEETCQSGSCTTTAVTPITSTEDEALVATPASHCPRSDITCFFCTKKGHHCSQCPDHKAWEAARNSGGAHAAEEVAYAESDWAVIAQHKS